MIEPSQKTSTNNQESKIMIALIAAPLTPAILISFIAFFMTVLDDYPETTLETISTFVGAGFIVFFVAFVHTFLLGAPLFILASRFKLIRWWTTLIGSFIVGSTPCGVLMFPYKNISDGLSVFMEMAGFMGLWGLSGGITFWLLWRYWIQEKSSDNFDANN